MSLKIWLPLNGDLHNQGLSNIIVTNHGATVDNNGKIGKCYYFNANAYLNESNYDWTNFNKNTFSLCCWYKEPSPVAASNSQMICIGTNYGWNNIRIGLLRRNSNGCPMFSVSDGSTAVQYSFTADNFPLDTWTHITCTYDNGIMKMYLNGQLHKTYTTTIVPALNSSQHLGIGAASNGAEKLTGYLNDVRIYDHALSLKEIKEISKGLVLHYPFDNINSNLNSIENTSGYSNIGTPTGTISYLSDMPRYDNAVFFDGNQSYYQLSKPMYNLYNQDFTISVWLKPQDKARGVIISEYGTTGASNVALQVINTNRLRVYWNGAPDIKGPIIPQNEWSYVTIVKTDDAMKFYINGKLEYTYNQTGDWSQRTSSAQPRIGDDYRGNTTNTVSYKGGMSDFRFYATALLENNIKELYKTIVSIDRYGNYYTNCYNELPQNREIEYLYNLTTKESGTYLQNEDGLHLNQKIWVTHDYISINPIEKIYKFDIVYSCDAGNRLYVGWERYDASKTARNNNACVYAITAKPSENAIKIRKRGIINLSTDGVNPCAFIKLRILNKWTNSDSDTTGQAIIHSLSLKEYSDDNILIPLNNTKQGIVNTTEIIENDVKVNINDTYELNSNNFYEI